MTPSARTASGLPAAPACSSCSTRGRRPVARLPAGLQPAGLEAITRRPAGHHEGFNIRPGATVEAGVNGGGSAGPAVGGAGPRAGPMTRTSRRTLLLLATGRRPVRRLRRGNRRDRYEHRRNRRPFPVLGAARHDSLGPHCRPGCSPSGDAAVVGGRGLTLRWLRCSSRGRCSPRCLRHICGRRRRLLRLPVAGQLFAQGRLTGTVPRQRVQLARRSGDVVATGLHERRRTQTCSCPSIRRASR